MPQTRKPTRDDLQRAALAALASGDPNELADAAELFADASAEGLERETPQKQGPPAFRVRGTRDWDRPPGERATPSQGANDNRGQTPTGPAALRTGHGMARGGGPRRIDGPAAYQDFIDALRPAMRAAGDSIQVTERRGWVKIESLVNGHKVYIAKSKTAVSRIESTIPPEAITGAAAPDRANGRIASWIPADPEVVTQAIEYLATSEDTIRPPQRGGGDTEVDARNRGPAVGRTSSRQVRGWVPPGNGNGRR